jgi:metal-responsive CopG/Arc/MetJ family transcriptional regulator
LDNKTNKTLFATSFDSDGILPVKGYDSVNLPSGLYVKVKSLVKARSDLGYRSVTEFVAEAVRKRTEEIEKANSLKSQLEGQLSSSEAHKRET